MFSNALSRYKGNDTQMKGFVSETVKNIVVNGKNAGFQRSLLFLKCFQILFPSGDCVVKE